MNGGCSDDEDSPVEEIFSNRAEKIIETQHEAFKKLLTKESTEKNAKEEQEDMIKIQEKLEKKRLSRKAKASPRKKTKKKASPVQEASPPKKTKKKSSPILQASPPKKTKKKSSPILRRSSRIKQKNNDEIQKIETENESLNLPEIAKMRLKLLEAKTSRQEKRIDKLNQRILSACNVIDDDSTFIDIAEQEVNLKIRYLYEILRLDVNENENFASILSKVAELLNIKPSEVVLCLEDQTIDLKATPYSMNIKSWNIIDCIPYKPSDDESDILIKMQSNDSKKRIDMYAHKLDKFKELMEKYASLRGLPLKDLIFEFDGEKINASDTPEDLDMESGSCVDVKVTGDSFKSKPSTSMQYVHCEKEIPEDQMRQICFLD